MLQIASVKAARLADRIGQPLLVRLNARAKWWPVGHFPLRSGYKFDWLHVGDRIIQISVPAGESDRQQWEFNHLYHDDPYRLADLPRGLKTILDVGGNIGFFAMIARHYFPRALIHCYEPDKEVFQLLTKNTDGLGVVAYNSGISLADGSGYIVKGDCSLSTSINTRTKGSTPLISIRTAVDRLGSTIDLLKLDCEGAEWDILQDTATLRRVRYLAMEYHFTGTQSLELWELVRLLKDEGFAIKSLSESEIRVVGQLTAVNLGSA